MADYYYSYINSSIDSNVKEKKTHNTIIKEV